MYKILFDKPNIIEKQLNDLKIQYNLIEICQAFPANNDLNNCKIIVILKLN